MYRWTVTTRSTKHKGEEPTIDKARKVATLLAEKSEGGGIVTIDDLENGNKTFEIFNVSQR
jgi:hypothetical protein